MSLRVKPTVFLVILSSSVQLPSATARGHAFCETGRLPITVLGLHWLVHTNIICIWFQWVAISTLDIIQVITQFSENCELGPYAMEGQSSVFRVNSTRNSLSGTEFYSELRSIKKLFWSTSKEFLGDPEELS